MKHKKFQPPTPYEIAHMTKEQLEKKYSELALQREQLLEEKLYDEEELDENLLMADACEEAQAAIDERLFDMEHGPSDDAEDVAHRHDMEPQGEWETPYKTDEEYFPGTGSL